MTQPGNLCARIEVYQFIDIFALMRLSTCSTALALSLLATCAIFAQQQGDEKQEFSVIVGELSGGNPNASTPTVPAALNLDAGVAVEANFARKIRDLGFASAYWEVNGLVGPLRYLSGTPVNATQEIHSVFLTPGVKLQFTPKEPLSPWVAGGAGYAFYDSSKTSIAGGPTVGGTANTYAIDFGGGVDWAMGKRYVLRGEVRGIYTGNPNFGVPTSGGQFNFVIGGGIVWRFSK
jgi:hypothetical protein